MLWPVGTLSKFAVGSFVINNIIDNIFKVGKYNSTKLIKANYGKHATKNTYKNPKFTIKFLHTLQLQSRGMALIFLLTMSNVWDSLISLSRVCHNFWPTNLTASMPCRFVLALGKTRLVPPRRLCGTTLLTNISAIKDGFKLLMVL